MNPKNPDKWTFPELVEFIKENPEAREALVSYLEDGRDGALGRVLSEESSEYGDTKRNITAALYSELASIFK